MSKRKLSRQQRWRVEKIQQERAQRAAKRAGRAQTALDEQGLGAEETGVVIAHFGAQLDIEGEDGTVQRCHLRANLDGLVTGDRVVWRRGDTQGVAVAAVPRHSELCRPDPQGRLRPVAANIDHIVIVIAPRPAPHANLIDRYLVAAETAGIAPLLLLNKTDLLPPGGDTELDALLANYTGIGYPVLRACNRSSDGLDELQSALRERTSVFVGQSGVGKSSLIRHLLPGVDIRVGALSGDTGKGTHTTTTARLYHLPAGGQLIDSPGIREFGLWHMDETAVANGFIEFRPYLGHCKFRDCRHQQEPGCALLEALERGEISAERFASFEAIVAAGPERG